MILQVLHMDRNDYYGGDSTSLNLNQVSMSNEVIPILEVLDVLTHFFGSIYYHIVNQGFSYWYWNSSGRNLEGKTSPRHI